MHALSDYTYNLPQELIAQTPAQERSRSRLMVLNRATGEVDHRMFHEISLFLRPGDALVLNDTKVIPARLGARRSSGGRVEILLLERGRDDCWEALVKPTARLKAGEALRLAQGGEALLNQYLGSGIWSLTMDGLSREEGLLELGGRMPLPHYINRDKDFDPRDAMDRERYQTVYGVHPGAVAAPTAGLHFTSGLLDAIEARGIHLVKLTLHVGVGTFAPLREEDVQKHKMHSEQFILSRESVEILERVKKAGGRVAAVGTTSARVLETAAREDGTLRPASGRTELYIYPPFRFKAVDLLLTNFHLPQSTLLLLVSAFAGREKVLAAYEEAIRKGYRFYSYGDAMLLGDHLSASGTAP